MASSITKNGIKLMFLASQRFEQNEAVRGAFLITDCETKPLEFRCTTNPIRPTTLQKTLYGELLEQHMVVELIAIPLVRAAKEKPDLILVREPIILEIRPRIEIPMLRIFKEDEIVIGSDSETSNQESNLLGSESGKFEPVIVSAHRDFAEERDKYRNILQEVFKRHNLLEPFERIATALEQVHQTTALEQVHAQKLDVKQDR